MPNGRRREVGDEGAWGEEEGGAVVGGEVVGHVVDLQELGLEAAADLGPEGVGGGEDEEAVAGGRR